MNSNSWLLIALAGVAVPFAIAFGIIGLGEGRGISNARVRKACDVVVQRLMITTDPVELRRDAILADHLRCDVTRRAVPVLVPETASTPSLK